MTIFIQLATDARDPESASHQRAAFLEYVMRYGDLARDRIILIEPNPYLAQLLRSLWSAARCVQILPVPIHEEASQREREGRSIVFFRGKSDKAPYESMGPHKWSVRQRFPDSDVQSVPLAFTGASVVLDHLGPASEIEFVALDPSALGVRDSFASGYPSSDLQELLGRTHRVALSFNSLISPAGRHAATSSARRGAGFVLAGRAWGEAGESVLLIRPRSMAEHMHAASCELRVRFGQAIVFVRDRLFGQSTRFRLKTFVRQSRYLDFRGSHVLDRSGRSGLLPVPRWEVSEALDGINPGVISDDLPSWSTPRQLAHDPWEVSRECHSSHGVWPLSFSFPREPLAINPQPHEIVSPITPGYHYSFHDERRYLETYANAYWGFTHRKAGWDCFRHVEILASGALPWMIDADRIPRFSMVHYPKEAMSQAAARLRRGPCIPDALSRELFREFFRQHLTSKAMARYLLSAVGQESCESVLFVDEQLPKHADYQSVLTLIGLKQLLGPRCQVMFPVDYVYEDSLFPSRDLYGRGFGYTRVLPPEARSDSERGRHVSDLAKVDVVVVGSISRNRTLGLEMLKYTDPRRVVWIHGEDLPPTIDEVSGLRESRVNVFVRSIHVSR